ncbi:MAG: ABC transporter ATP-binding protein [Planctomycetota bacterium]|nr:ABC transporter ATP-binding protein [Planctomycetota bacterium]
MLEVDRLSSGYGKLAVLRDVGLSVREREIVVILGANGAGKSTLLRTLSGLIRATGGSARLNGEEMMGQAPHRLARQGIAHVPEGRGIFADQSVQDNLELGAFGWARGRRSKMAAEFDRVYTLFPALAERRRQRAGTLSGGQQQMVAIGRALMARPRLMLLDEPSLGLAPLVVSAIFETVRQLRENGMAILLVEQNARAALSLADRAYVLSIGRIVASGAAHELAKDQQIQRSYLGGIERRGAAA